jgi:hypothetical protein
MMEIKRHSLFSLTAGLLVFALSGCTSFELTSWPQAEVYENDERIGVTPYTFSLVSGSRSLTLRRQGYIDREVCITAVDPMRRHVELEWIGRSTVDSLPAGARIVRLEDGRELGITPCRLGLARPVDVVFRMEGFEESAARLVPNRNHIAELKPVHGFKPAFFRSIYFSSSQGAVEIYDRVAGERIGITPVQLKLAAGSKLEYRLPGHAPAHELISRNGPHRVEVRLTPLREVEICGPAGTRVYRAGGEESIGEVPFAVTVEEGTELFELRKAGYYDRAVAVAPDSPAQITVQLEKIPFKTIVTDPPGAAVYRLGGQEKLGSTPYTAIIETESVFEIRKEGCKAAVIGVGPSSPDQLKVQLAPLPPDEPEAAAIGDLDSSLLNTF